MAELSKLSLNAGELSDELAGRIDLSKFNSGCETLENAKVLRAGGVTRRAGFEYVDDVIDNAYKSRLVGFRYSDGQGYVMEFSNLKMRVIFNGVALATIYTTPWTEAQIFDLQFAQKIDRIVVTHPGVPVYNIIKTGTATWEVNPYPWIVRVWEDYTSPDVFTLTPSATIGNGIDITSSANLFGAVAGPTGDWVGDRIRLAHTVNEVSSSYDTDPLIAGRVEFVNTATSHAIGDVVWKNLGGDLYHWTCIQAYTPADDTGALVPSAYPTFFKEGFILVPETTVNAGWVFETFLTWEGVLLIERSYDGGATWPVIKTITSVYDRNERVTETETQSAIIRVTVKIFQTNRLRAEFTQLGYEAFGSAVVTSVTSPTVVVVDIEEDFNSTDAASSWQEAAFSPRNGYPAAATFYQSRLALGGTTTRPQTLWLSRTQSPFDFTVGTLATDGMSFQTDAEGYESITWLSSHISLLVGTTLGVWSIYSPSGAPLTPESNGINRQMQLGAQPGFQAAPLQSNILFLQNKGRKIQELTGGSTDYGGYISADLTQLATHITRGGVTQISVGSSPDSALYLVTGGEVAMLTYERSQNVVGWGRWKTDGLFESFTTTTGLGEDDDIYAVVNRNGNRYIEHQAPDMLRAEEDDDVENLRFLDCYTERIEVTEFTTVSGLSRFDGESVEVFIDGEPSGNVTVTGGVATLPRAGLNVIVGVPYTTEVRPMSIDFGVIGSKSAIINILIRFRNTLGGEVSQDRVNWTKIRQEQPRILTDTPLVLQSQDYQSTPHSTWGRKPSISVRQTAPLPMTILAMRIQTKSSK